MKYSMMTILGPTASGKTSLAAALAARINSLGAHLSGTPAKALKSLVLTAGRYIAAWI